jgi:hypothetical protein
VPLFVWTRRLWCCGPTCGDCTSCCGSSGCGGGTGGCCGPAPAGCCDPASGAACCGGARRTRGSTGGVGGGTGRAAAAGQSALTNTLVNKCEAAAALYRMRNDPPAAPVRVDPGSAFGKQLLQLLDGRRGELERASAAGAAGAWGGGLLGPAALHAAAYPDAARIVAAAAAGLRSGRVKAWVVPFQALNPEGCPPQVGGGRERAGR